MEIILFEIFYFVLSFGLTASPYTGYRGSLNAYMTAKSYAFAVVRSALRFIPTAEFGSTC